MTLLVLVETINGQPLRSGSVVAATKPLWMWIGLHVEELKFYMVAAPHFLLMLGLEWLQAHDLQILWSMGVVDFTSPKCTAHHLHTCSGETTGGQSLDLSSKIIWGEGGGQVATSPPL